MPTTTLDAVRAGLSLKIRENRARRALCRQGRLLIKSRTGDPTYMVIDDFEEWIKA
jgi:hypothetical protein